MLRDCWSQMVVDGTLVDLRGTTSGCSILLEVLYLRVLSLDCFGINWVRLLLLIRERDFASLHYWCYPVNLGKRRALSEAVLTYRLKSQQDPSSALPTWPILNTCPPTQGQLLNGGANRGQLINITFCGRRHWAVLHSLFLHRQKPF